MIPAVQLEEVKGRIIEIIGERVELIKRGRVWKGCCPFHDDRHPSFEVNESRKAWFCNPCGIGGDLIAFIKKFHDTDFIGAVKLLGLQGDSVSREQSAKYRNAVKRIREDEAAHLLIHRRKFDGLCEISRSLNFRLNENDPGLNRAEVEFFIDRNFKLWELEKELIEEVFADRRHELRGAL